MDGEAFGGLEVGSSLLVKVAFDHRDGGRRIEANLCRGESGPGSEMPGVDCGTPGGKNRGEEGGVEEGDAIGDGG